LLLVLTESVQGRPLKQTTLPSICHTANLYISLSSCPPSHLRVHALVRR
jgi:hypothetical protein